MFQTALQILGKRVAFGAGRAGDIGRDVVALAGPGARALLVTDPGVVAAGLAEPVEAALTGAGLSSHLFKDVRSDPLSSQIDAAQLNKEALDVVNTTLRRLQQFWSSPQHGGTRMTSAA